VFEHAAKLNCQPDSDSTRTERFMFSMPGRASRTCEGVTRREWIRAGGLSALGVGLEHLLTKPTMSAEPNSRTPLPPESFGRAKSCIVLFMFGAPAHQDTWDMKPEAPAEVRGEFSPIPSAVPGIMVSEHLPLLSRMTDRFTQIRSVTHPDNTHTVAMHYMLTGVRHQRPQTNPQNAADDFPCFGAVMNSLNRASNRKTTLPAGVSLNAPANQVSANNHIFPGFFGGFLGRKHDPLFISQHPNDQKFEPFPTVDSVDRLLDRQRLLDHFDQHAKLAERSHRVANLHGRYEQAMSLLTSSKTRQAFDLHSESAVVRSQFGMTPFGQGCLLARRLVESGVRLVTVNWERDDAYWDTHSDNFNKHRKQLLPNLDRGFSTLLTDLEQRGILDETLVVWLAEFGRTPKINSKAGRDHWAACNTVLLAGAGIPGGQVYGASDRQAAYPTRDPVSPEDLAATIYHLLGVDPDTLIRTPDDRPVPLSTGKPVHPIL
jgi:hypothetical protein